MSVTDLNQCYQLLSAVMDHIALNQHTLALETLVSLMQLICTHVQDLGLCEKSDQTSDFWNKVNDTWIQVLKSCHGMDPQDWVAVSDAIESCGNVLELYGLVDYPFGFQESRVLEKIMILA